MPFQERLSIIKEMKIVDNVISFNDNDDSACGAIFYMLSTNRIKKINKSHKNGKKPGS